MTTVKDVREIFAKKGLYFEHLPCETFLVKGIEVVERFVTRDGYSKVALRLKYINAEGKDISDLFFCEGKTKHAKVYPPPIEVTEPVKLEPLPLRHWFEFDSEREAITYLKKAITHLLRDKDYDERGREDCDLYFVKLSVGFFINLTTRFDESGLKRAKELIDLRMHYGSENNYGLVAPAFQDSLGISLLQQEHWLRIHGEFLAMHRIGIYTVNNKNPNQIFPFTIYPQKDENSRDILCLQCSNGQ